MTAAAAAAATGRVDADFLTRRPPLVVSWDRLSGHLHTSVMRAPGLGAASGGPAAPGVGAGVGGLTPTPPSRPGLSFSNSLAVSASMSNSASASTTAAATGPSTAPFATDVVRVWDLETENLVRELRSTSGGVVSCMEAYGDVFVAAGFVDGSIRIFDKRERDAAIAFSREHRDWVWTVRVRDFELVSGAASGDVRVWDVRMPPTLMASTMSFSVNPAVASSGPSSFVPSAGSGVGRAGSGSGGGAVPSDLMMDVFSLHKRADVVAAASSKHSSVHVFSVKDGVELASVKPRSANTGGFNLGGLMGGRSAGRIACVGFHASDMAMAVATAESIVTVFRPSSASAASGGVGSGGRSSVW